LEDVLMARKPTYKELEQRVKELQEEALDRQWLEEALRVESNNLINILNSMADGVCIVNQQYDIEYVNPALTKDFGRVEGRKCYEYFHDRKEVCPWCKNQDVFAGKTVHWEWYSFKNQRTYDLIDTPLKNRDGTISKLEIFRDITERKQMEEALKESEEKYRKLFEEIADPIFVADPETGILIDCNYAALELVGRKRSELIGKHQKILHPPEEIEGGYSKSFKEHISKQDGRVLEEQVITKKGEIKEVAIRANVIEVEGKKQIQGMFRDITERKQAEEVREKLIEELHDALVKVKTLSGLLPICASCKKIRDNKGNWNHIETYIREHSEADFSHGICPECSRKLYPELQDDSSSEE